jgi:hypothetical protein
MTRSSPNARGVLTMGEGRRHRAEDDLWLVQLYVVIRAAREPLSEESILAYVIRRKLREVPPRKFAGSFPL